MGFLNGFCLKIRMNKAHAQGCRRSSARYRL
jgi:hypothetical protein